MNANNAVAFGHGATRGGVDQYPCAAATAPSFEHLKSLKAMADVESSTNPTLEQGAEGDANTEDVDDEVR